MSKPPTPRSQSIAVLQLLTSFVIPIIILTKFSGEAQLGPTKGLLLALAFPIGFEIYNFIGKRKISYLSLLAIGGILVTGAISLLGLSENWLALRRAIPYAASGLALLISILIKRPLLAAALPLVLDMEKINDHARKHHQEPAIRRAIYWSGYMVGMLLMILSIASYILTKIIINSPTNTTGFNEEYARLRLLSLPLISLPLIIGITLVLFYLVTAIEKHTGMDFEDILKKK